MKNHLIDYIYNTESENFYQNITQVFFSPCLINDVYKFLGHKLMFWETIHNTMPK